MIFLKPTILKIVLGIILFFIIIYFSPCSFTSGWIGQAKTDWGTCRNFGFIIVSGGMVFDLSPKIWGIFGLSAWPKNIVPLLALLAVSYILSCLFVKIIKK